METSTCFRILKHSNHSSNEDFELNNRFYHSKKVEEFKNHDIQYGVWKKSMFIRYFLEVIIFLAALIYLQFQISEFNSDLHDLRKTLLEFSNGTENFSELYRLS
jgi:hypothetical protein